MIPISLVYSSSGMNDSFMNGGIGGQYLPQYNISEDIVTRCTAQSSVSSSHLSSHNFKLFCCSDIDHNDHYYHDPYSDMPRLSLVDKTRVIGQIQAGYTKMWMVKFVSGVDSMQSRPEPHWTVMGPAWESCSYQSHHRHHAGSPSDCGRWVECYTTAALFSGSYSVWGGGTRLLLRHLVVPPNANVINVSNEIYCGETFRVFNTNNVEICRNFVWGGGGGVAFWPWPFLNPPPLFGPDPYLNPAFLAMTSSLFPLCSSTPILICLISSLGGGGCMCSLWSRIRFWGAKFSEFGQWLKVIFPGETFPYIRHTGMCPPELPSFV